MHIKQNNISFDQCIKCTICTIYCPVSRVTEKYPGPKLSGPDAERLRIKNPELVDNSLTYCNNCKRCEVACPSDVDITELINNAKRNYIKQKWFRIRDYILSRTDMMGQLATKFAGLTNIFLKSIISKFFFDLFLKIPYKVSYPSFNKGTFSKWFNKNLKLQKNYSRYFTYFHGCYVNYYDAQLGKDLIFILNSCNIGVNIINEKCCGVPLIANGYLNKAKQHAKHNTKLLTKQKDSKIIITSSSCTLAIKNEYPNLLKIDNSAIVNKIEYATKILTELFEKEEYKNKLHPLNIRVAYHTPCHLERLGGVLYTISLLKKIPGLELILLNSECCGIAGTYGFKKEYYEISQDIGEQLFKKIQSVDPEYVVTDCETCAMQIKMNTDYEVLHPVNILSASLKNYI